MFEKFFSQKMFGKQGPIKYQFDKYLNLHLAVNYPHPFVDRVLLSYYLGPIFVVGVFCFG